MPHDVYNMKYYIARIDDQFHSTSDYTFNSTFGLFKYHVEDNNWYKLSKVFASDMKHDLFSNYRRQTSFRVYIFNYMIRRSTLSNKGKYECEDSYDDMITMCMFR